MATWSEKPYRGETSFNIPEMAGWNNKQTLIWSLVITGILVGGYFFLKKTGTISELVGEEEERSL